MLYLITEWGVDAEEFLQAQKEHFQDDEDAYKTVVRTVHRKALESSKFLHALGFSHFDIKLKNMMIREKSENDFDVVFIDFGSGQAGNSISIQRVDHITTLSCATPNLLFGPSQELCCQKRDIFTLTLQQVGSFVGVSNPGDLLCHISDDLKVLGKVPEAFYTYMKCHWLANERAFRMERGALTATCELTPEGKKLADLAYAYLVLAHTEDETVMTSIVHMWNFDKNAAADLSRDPQFSDAVRIWSLASGFHFRVLKENSSLFQALQFGIHPCGPMRPTAEELFTVVHQAEEQL